MFEPLTINKPFSKPAIYEVLSQGVDYLRIQGGRPVIVAVRLGDSPTDDELVFTHPYVFEAFVRGMIVNPICETLSIDFIDD